MSNTTDSIVTDDEVRELLEEMIELEPNPDTINSMEHYESYMAPHQERITEVRARLRLYAEQMQPASLEEMQDAYYHFTEEYSGVDQSVANGTLGEAWHGVGPWRQ